MFIMQKIKLMQNYLFDIIMKLAVIKENISHR